jgi:hypothetical protein
LQQILRQFKTARKTHEGTGTNFATYLIAFKGNKVYDFVIYKCKREIPSKLGNNYNTNKK